MHYRYTKLPLHAWAGAYRGGRPTRLALELVIIVRNRSVAVHCWSWPCW